MTWKSDCPVSWKKLVYGKIVDT